MIGSRVAGRYRLDAELGRGGMGVVYQAYDTVLKRDVAVKLLAATGLGTEERARLMNEAQAAASLNHPNIVAVHDAGEWNDEDSSLPFIVMELLKGPTLHEWPLKSLGETLEIIRQLCAALQHAHDRGIIHRDVKPENVMLADDATVKLMDFGLARSLTTRMTAEGAIMGTLYYMAPEMIMGQEVDGRSDLYALGVMLYEMTAGRLPFEADDPVAVLSQHLHAMVTPPSVHNPQLPPELDHLIVSLLAKEPDKRPSSAKEVLAALELEGDEHAPGRFRHKLPADLSRFVGRQDEIFELHDLILQADHRLVTIVAPGGMGKTRLAIATARRFTGGQFPDGIFFVPLEPISDPTHIAAGIAEAANYQFQEDQRTPEMQIRDFLREKQVLLILDNFEHLLDGASIVIDLLEAAPGLTVLITSRDRLHLSNAIVYLLGGLTYSTSSPFVDAQEYDATQLFIDSARRQNSHFNPDEEGLSMVAQICRMVEGMPLAIVLAASWVEVLSLSEVSAELQHSLDLLAADMRDLPRRQRSIRAVIDYAWSWLDDEGQDVLMRFSVFRGGATREAIEAVTGGRLRTLAGLVDRSMLRRDMSNDRFEVHELVRQFAAEKLGAFGQFEDTRHAHSAYYAALLERQTESLKGRGQTAAQEIIGADVDNVRMMWDWAAERGRYDDLDRAIPALDLFFELRDRYHEASELFGELAKILLARGISAQQVLLGKALIRQGRAHELLGAFERAEESLVEGLELIRQSGNQQEVALATYYRGHNAWRMRDNELALSLAEEAEHTFEALGDRWGLAKALQVKGNLFERRIHVDLAVDMFQKSRHFQHEIGDKAGEGFSNYYLGEVVMMDGRFEEARPYLEAALRIFQEMNNRRGVSYSLNQIGWLNAYIGDYDKAESLFEQFLSLSRDIGYQDRIAEGLIALAYVSWYTDDHAAAEQGFQKSLKLAEKANLFSDHLVAAYIGLAHVMNSQKRHRQAIAYARQALALESEYYLSILHMLLGEATSAMGDVAAGRIHFRDSAHLTVGLPKIWKIRFLARLPRLSIAEGESVRAVQLLTCALNSESLVFESRRKALTMLEEMESELPANTFEAAVEQGNALDFREVLTGFLNDSEA